MAVLTTNADSSSIYYIYQHIDEHGEIRYIGKGSKRRAWSTRGRNRHWNNVFSKFKRPKVVILIENLTEMCAYELEKEYIAAAIANGSKLCNINEGGFGCTERLAKKYSESKKGKRLSDSQKQKISNSNKGHYFGERKPLSDKHKKAVSDALKGHIVSAETRKKISEKNKGQKLSAEHREKLSKAHIGKKLSPEKEEKRLAGLRRALTGKKRTPEVCAKISKGHIGRIRGPHSPEHKLKVSNALKKTLREKNWRKLVERVFSSHFSLSSDSTPECPEQIQ